MLSVPNGAQSVGAHCCSGLSVVQMNVRGVGRGRQMSNDVRTAQCSVVRPVRLLIRVAIDRQADQVPSGSEMAQKVLRLFHA